MEPQHSFEPVNAGEGVGNRKRRIPVSDAAKVVE